jgi:hypothetical protein
MLESLATQLTDAERIAFRATRIWDQTGEHPFTERELAHLRFQHWLVHCPVWDWIMDGLDGVIGAGVSAQDITVWTSGLTG